MSCILWYKVILSTHGEEYSDEIVLFCRIRQGENYSVY